MTLLDYLAGRFRYQSIETWNKMILEGRITLKGAKAQPSQVLEKGDRIAYRVVLREPPVDGNIRILHEEETFLVAEKPGNLPSHADGTFIKHTFIHILTQNLRKSGWQGDVRLVHRLDRETSGLMVVAKQREAHRNLVKQFESGTVEKEYLALVQGRVEKDSFEVAGAIGRSPASQISIRRQVLPEGTPGAQPSLTLFQSTLRYDSITLVRCLPKTGRTNQIRVHLEYVGHPVLGDRLYGRTDEEYLAFVKAAKEGKALPPLPDLAPRLMLHAHKLAFSHPVTGQKIAFESPMPEDMSQHAAHYKTVT
jgi:RluA family pseudouridine synthase